eukprot:CAMPEP_0178454806 /NCGR_PEP_ID=MMETSP0689_2-20121128/45569_1 /TAXON_ID=160604 /ORGANISM="Amphidinium massartii, Strain CS-259" /LENGTH=290 /DNA_ID=CAMNT_0020080793 /DNA_START=10 /DNA_END=879 /DNA_ORIENTATION=+
MAEEDKEAREAEVEDAAGSDGGSSSDGEQVEANAAAASGSGSQGGKNKGRKVVLSDGRVVSCKVRNHVNPLQPHFQKPVPVPTDGGWSKIYGDLAKPAVLDLGCAKADKKFPKFNWLGIEIREPLVARANEWVQEQKLDNLHYIFGNASAGMTLLGSMPPGFVKRVTIQCPDPLFKKKHQKRRMVTDRLVAELASHMSEGAMLFVQSDVEQVAMQMVDTVAANGTFERITELSGSILDENSSGEQAAPVAPVPRPRPIDGGDFHNTSIGGGEWEHKGAGAEPDGSYQWLP